MNRAAHEFHTCRGLGWGRVRSFLRALDYGWPDVWLLPSVPHMRMLSFIAWRDKLTMEQAIKKIDAMSLRDRRRLARSMRKQQPCESYYLDCGCQQCRTHEKLKELLA